MIRSQIAKFGAVWTIIELEPSVIQAARLVAIPSPNDDSQ